MGWIGIGDHSVMCCRMAFAAGSVDSATEQPRHASHRFEVVQIDRSAEAGIKGREPLAQQIECFNILPMHKGFR
jgi:hypothetical protein